MLTENTNLLYPVFLRLDKLKILVIGAGEVGEEKMSFILKSSPNANITIVATWVGDGVAEVLSHYPDSNVKVIIKPVEESDIPDHDIIVSATCFHDINRQVHTWAKKYNKIINVADTPDLCDFYMGSIVTKGDLKIAISTNGKSPTFSKRFRQYLEEILDDSTANLIDNLKKIRDKMNLDFKGKVDALNKITETMIEKTEQPSVPVTLVIGASTKEDRYSNMAVKRLHKFGHEVIAVGTSDGEIDGTPVIHSTADLEVGSIDTITMYISPEHQASYVDEIKRINPRRVIFNPGTENVALYKHLDEANIGHMEACTLVLLNTGQY